MTTTDDLLTGPAPLGAAQPSVVAHLTPDAWDRATRWIVRKALAEYSHERLLVPKSRPDGRWEVPSDGGTSAYLFSARVLPLDHWAIEADSIVREVDGEPTPLDALTFHTELREQLCIGEGVLPLLLEELTATLSARASRLSRPALTAAEVAAADYQTVEAAMTEGHPCFVANSGRVGFDPEEYAVHAPEAGADQRLVWVAVDRAWSTFAAVDGLDEEMLLGAEFDEATLDRFRLVLAERGRDLGDVHLMPVHPWQWRRRIAVTFAHDIAAGRIVLLGEGDDLHRPQQSIRTFFNTTRPERSYVKTALSVLNMGFLRGLSAAYMSVTPAINQWVADVVWSDGELRRLGFDLLREHASLGYHSEHYEAAAPPGDPHLKMLAALWRESPVTRLGEGERLLTMASLLHVDEAGRSVVAALVEESGVGAPEWLGTYLRAYLRPLVHLMYAHDLLFMPHGENLILVVRDGLVDRVLMKDIGEEVVLASTMRPVPPAVERIRADLPPGHLELSVLTDVVDCFLRFLSAVVEDAELLPVQEFWAVVAGVVADYEVEHPELRDRFAAHDLFADEFPLSCLNRLQLRNNQQMVDLTDQSGSLQFAGTLANPLAPHRPDRG